jgi:hypothetical protein
MRAQPYTFPSTHIITLLKAVSHTTAGCGSCHSCNAPRLYRQQAGQPQKSNSLWQTLGMNGCLRPTRSHMQMQAGISMSHSDKQQAIPDAAYSPRSLWQTLGMKGCQRSITYHTQLHAGIIYIPSQLTAVISQMQVQCRGLESATDTTPTHSGTRWA